MKILYSTLQLELTRKCNENCKHCYHGKSEDVNLTTEIITNFLDKNEIQGIYQLEFEGGEPTLNEKALNYFIEEIIKRKIPVYSFSVSVNGTIYNEDFIKDLNKLNDYCGSFFTENSKQNGILWISQTQYHELAKEEVIKSFSSLPYFVYSNGRHIEEEHIFPFGNAKENKLTKNKIDIDKLEDVKESFQIVKENLLYIKNQYITAYGDVLVNGMIPYSLMDDYKLGNVRETPIACMYDKEKSLVKIKK